MTEKEILSIISRIKFLDWKFEGRFDCGVLHLRMSTHMVDNDNSSQKIVVQQVMTMPIIYLETLKTSQILEIIFNNVVSQLKHEAGELFLFNDKAPFNEHFPSTERELIKSIFDRELVM